jgi:hypothetical protein
MEGVIESSEKYIEGVQMNWEIPIKSVFYGLHRGTRQGNKIPLRIIVNIDSISGLEGDGRNKFSVIYEQTMFGKEIC